MSKTPAVKTPCKYGLNRLLFENSSIYLRNRAVSLKTATNNEIKIEITRNMLNISFLTFPTNNVVYSNTG